MKQNNTQRTSGTQKQRKEVNKPNFLLRFFGLALVFLLAGVSESFAQTLTQSGFTGVIVPQYMGSGNLTRLPIMFRASLTGLTASTSYRYYTQAALSTAIGTASSGAGNPLLISSNGSSYSYTAAPTFTNAGTYETFTTDATGNYTGWFGFVYTSNGAFTAGNVVYPTITLNGSGSSTTVASRRALDLGITVLAFSATAGATNGSLLQSTSSSATAKNLVAIYDNTAGTGRPLAVTVVESIGATIASVPTSYSTTGGAWNTIMPNNNANGVRRIEQRSVADNSIVGCATDADGTWATGSISTANPTNGTTWKAISSTDAPLSSCSSASPSITGAATATAFTTTYGTASAAQSFSISGSGLSASLIATAPTGFAVSRDNSTFQDTVQFTQSSGSASGTLYIRLKADASVTGSYNSQNIVLSSTGASSVNIVTASSGNAVTAKALTITGVTADNKVYDGTASATLTGSAAYSGLVAGETYTVTGTASASFTGGAVGNGKTVSVTGYTAPTSNYSLTQPSLSADITEKALTITGI
ncbi:MAG: hypothetical protein K9I70_08195 [Chitinophagaceae bacterium]|nr:hypothetical protein [Chitinophagaceae bacterium]